MGKNIDEYISDKFVVNILWNLSKLTIHERPLTVYTNLMKSEKTFRDLNDVTNIYEHMNKEKFGKYKKNNENMFPGYAFYNGEYSCPSKLFFREKPLWTDDMNNKTFDIEDLSEMLRLRLQDEMNKYYGSYYPTNNSSHVMMHRTISNIIENKYPNEDKVTDDIIIDCVKAFAKTRGNYGDIYSKNILGSIIHTVNDFFRVKKNMINYATGNKDVDQSNSHKLNSELLNYGMKCDNGKVLFEIDLIGKPIMITHELDNFDDILERINNRFLNMH